MVDDDAMLSTAMTCANASLIADIVGHPADEPTVDDLVDGNADLSVEGVRGRLADLLEVDVVEWNDRGVSLTRSARSVFDERGLFPERVWKRRYGRSRAADEDRLANTCRRCGDTVLSEDAVVLVSWERFEAAEKAASGRLTYCVDCAPLPLS